MGVLDRKNKAGIHRQPITTLISDGSVVDGSLKAPAFARIDGQIKGSVEIAEGLILGKHGIIDGNVHTKEMVVHGTVNGNIIVSIIEIAATGKVTGDITTGALSVESGGVYNGRLIMNVK